jgi:hypothetical protein
MLILTALNVNGFNYSFASDRKHLGVLQIMRSIIFETCNANHWDEHEKLGSWLTSSLGFSNNAIKLRGKQLIINYRGSD